MSYIKISNLFHFDKLRPNFKGLFRNGLYNYPNNNKPFQQYNFSTNRYQNIQNSLQTIPKQNTSENINNKNNFDKYKKKIKYFTYLTSASYIFAKNPDDSINKKNNEENNDEEILIEDSDELENSSLDPFDDENVVYYHKNYSYESPSKDNKYYYEIHKFKYPNSKNVKIPKSIESDIDSFFINPFFGYYKRMKDQFNSVFDNVTPIMASEGNHTVRMEPFWVVMSNTPPTTFSNAFMLVCGAVFALWKLAENSTNAKFTDFMNKHFLASYESFKSKRYHTMLTAAISHTSLVHFGLNCMLFHQLMKTFHNNMSFYTPQSVNTSLQSFVRNIFGSATRFDTERRMGVNKNGRVTTNDIFNVMFLSSIASSLCHVYFYKTPVLGASGAISGLMYLLASTFPNSFFRTVFPLPGLNLSILQIGQLFVVTNLYFLLNGKKANIAWAAHLMGMGAGVAYCLFQQYVNRRPGFHNAFVLSAKTFRSQWKKTFEAFGKF